MDFNDMKIFATVVKLESITKTSEHLGYVQSHISKRIDKIEKELNCKLFKRTNRGVKLLPRGEELLSYITKILDMMESMEKDFKIDSYVINVGTTQTISSNYLCSLYLDKEINVFVRLIKELVEMYNQSIINILIVNRKIDSLKTKNIQSFSEKICWVKSCNKDNDIFDKPIIISRDIECPYRKKTIEYLSKYENGGITKIIEVDNFDILIKMVEENEAIAILPYKSVELNNKLRVLNTYELQDITIYIYYDTLSNKMKDLLKLLGE